MRRFKRHNSDREVWIDLALITQVTVNPENYALHMNAEEVEFVEKDIEIDHLINAIVNAKHRRYNYTSEHPFR